MEKYIVDERTGMEYELVGDYYLIAGDDEPIPEPLGIWGQRHRQFLREHKRCIYDGMLLTGKLDSYLREIDRQAEEMFSRLVEQMAEREGITEQLKAENQMAWIGAMNNIPNRAQEAVLHDIVYAEAHV